MEETPKVLKLVAVIFYLFVSEPLSSDRIPLLSIFNLQEYNGSQEKVISTAANAVHKPFPIPRICLVQGPPGTGKSFTIVGLVKEILNVSCNMLSEI